MEGEEWVLEYKPSRFYFILDYFLAGVFLVFALATFPSLSANIISLTIFLVLLGGFLFFLVFPERERRKRTYVLTKSSVDLVESVRKGKREVKIPYRDIVEVVVEQDRLMGFLGYGDVRIRVKGGEEFSLKGIENPREAVEIIKFKVEEQRKGKEGESKEEKGEEG